MLYYQSVCIVGVPLFSLYCIVNNFVSYKFLPAQSMGVLQLVLAYLQYTLLLNTVVSSYTLVTLLIQVL